MWTTELVTSWQETSVSTETNVSHECVTMCEWHAQHDITMLNMSDDHKFVCWLAMSDLQWYPFLLVVVCQDIWYCTARDGSVYIISVMTCGIVKKRIWRFSNVFVRKVVNMNVVILECRSVELNAVQPIIFEYSLRHHNFFSVILLKVTTSKKFYSCISCFSLYHNRSVTFVQSPGVSECKEIFFFRWCTVLYNW